MDYAQQTTNKKKPHRSELPMTTPGFCGRPPAPIGLRGYCALAITPQEALALQLVLVYQAWYYLIVHRPAA